MGRVRDGKPGSYKDTTRTWVFDPELLKIYTGDLESEVITEEQAEYIIRRIHPVRRL